MKMNISKMKQNAKRYKAIFDKALAEGLIYEGKEGKELYQIKDGEVFKQCFTTKKSAKYYQCRKQLQPYYFVSNYGTVVSTFYYGKAYTLMHITKEWDDALSRFAVTISFYYSNGSSELDRDKLDTDPCTLVGLVFEADCTSYAKAIMDKFGMRAFKRNVANDMGFSQIQCHHKEHYKYGKFNINPAITQAETYKYLADNCRVDNLLFIDVALHGKLENIKFDPFASLNAKTEAELKKAMNAELTRIKNTNDTLALHGMDNHAVVTVFDQKTKSADVIELPVLAVTIEPINAEAKAAGQATRQQDAHYIIDIARHDPEAKDGMLIESENKQRPYSVTLL